MRALLQLRLAIAVAIVLAVSRPAHATSWIGRQLSGFDWSVAILPAALVILVVAGIVLRQLSTYLAEKQHASQVARLFDTLATVADGIAATLLAHPPAPAAIIATVRDALIADGVKYARANLPDTIANIGVSDDTMAARLGNQVAGKLVAAAITGAPAGDAIKAMLSGVTDAAAAMLPAVPTSPAAAPAPAATI